MTLTSSTPTASARGAGPAVPSTGALAPVPVDDVVLREGFWGKRQTINARASILHCLTWMERTGWLANFDRTAGEDRGPRAGREFADSEIYKLLEAMAWEISRSGDPEIDRRFREVSARVLAAQSRDGYINTRFGGPGQPARYTDLEWGHELYCMGHLIQAAVARARTAGLDDELVQGAVRAADHIVREFGPEGRDAICGHPEIEPALVELARVTGDERYLRQAALFIDRRGRGTLRTGEAEASYFQDDTPVREAEVFRGHAVRALYLAAGAVDVAVETGDDELLEAVEHQWDRTLARRTYVTGGMGARHDWEAFGEDFELPSDRAYAETCAAIGSVMVGWRLLLATGRERHADQIERAMFNVIAAAPDEHGTSFFYVNPLQRTIPGTPALSDEPSPRAASSQRAPWFEVSCCPTNTARTLASLGAYVASLDEEGIRIHQYASCDVDTVLRDGERVRLRVTTDYPHDGRVVVDVLEGPRREWTLSFRVPRWGDGRVRVDAGARRVDEGEGIVTVRGRLEAGETVELDLPVEPRLTLPDPRIDAVRGCAVVEAGPIVYCLESVDAPSAVELATVSIRADSEPVRGAGDEIMVDARVESVRDRTWAYSSGRPAEPAQDVEVTLIPYHRWAERGPSTMRVWLPVSPAGHTTRIIPQDEETN